MFLIFVAALFVRFFSSFAAELAKALVSAFLICGGNRVALLGLVTKCFVCA